jgi:hypothetical protein
MTTPLTPFDAFVAVLRLAIDAPDQERMNRAIILAEQYLWRFPELTPRKIEQAKRQATRARAVSP